MTYKVLLSKTIRDQQSMDYQRKQTNRLNYKFKKDKVHNTVTEE